MKIHEVIEKLKISEYQGFQLEKRNGILTSTWLIYKQDEFYYCFDINQKIEFTNEFKYLEKEILDEFKNSNFEIDLPIN
ncbi:MAG: hypothetical protein V4561_03065 [Bacteroidota bacterium]